MKTFEEAITAVIPAVTDDPDVIRRSTASLLKERERFAAINDEVQASPQVQALIHQAIVWAATGKSRVFEVLFTMFMYGLQIGMEMEKHE